MIRPAVRTLYRNPRFTLGALLTLAVAIGANTAIYSVVNALLIRPLPGVQAPGRLVTLKRLQLNNPDYVFGYPDYLDYRSQVTTLAGLAAHIRCPLVWNNGETVRADLVSDNYFQVLAVQPHAGRLPGAGEEVELSYGFWQRAFAGDAGAIGSSIQLGSHTYLVVGVAARNFEGTVPGAPVDVWLPLAMQPWAIPRLSRDILQSRTAGWLNVFGRLRPGASLEQAGAELKTIAGRMAHTYPDTNEHRGVDVLAGVGLDPDDKATLAGFFRLLMGAVGALLLIACTNVAGLMLIRAAARRREMAIRRAMGASQGQIARQLLTEGLLLSLLAGVAGLALSPWIAKLLLTFRQPLYSTTGLDVTPDWRVLAFTLAIASVAGVGLSLASIAMGRNPRSKAPSVLVALEIGMSLVLLVGAGLAVRTMRNVLHGDPGFASGNLLLLPADHYPELLNRVRNMPGVKSASLASTVPPRDLSSRLSVFYEGQAPPADQLRGHEFELGLRVDADFIAPEFFRTMGIPILEGRDFSAVDSARSPHVALVSQTLAQRLWSGHSAIGRRIEIPEPVQIVGVVKDIRYRSLLVPPPLLLYLPLAQNSDARTTLVVRTAGDPMALLTLLRGTTIPLAGARTLSEEIDESLWQQEMAVGLIGGLGVVALLLAAMGIYSVTAHWVALSTHEIGIRLAIGAQRADIVHLVLRRGFAVTICGIALGVPAALAANRLLVGLLYGTSPDDPATLAAVALLVTGSAVAATSFPARRAMLVDPAVALKTE